MSTEILLGFDNNSMSQQSIVTGTDLKQLFDLYCKDASQTPEQLKKILDTTRELFKKDYVIQVVQNQNGSLCSTYPSEIFIITSHKESRDSTKVNNPTQLEKLFVNARQARLRTRFPVPVILYKNKNICRSSTLAQKIECLYNSKTGLLETIQNFSFWPVGNNSDTIMDSCRSADIQLLRDMHIKYICDLMVENKKRKYGISVSSSEKTDKLARYGQFSVSALPFPGTEFFSSWHSNAYQEKMKIDWSEFGTEDTAILVDVSSPVPLDFNGWKSWDVVTLTQHYLKLMLSYLTGDSASKEGVLIHCISGWDRTPLYTSLLRLSLWADGVIHQSLDASEIVYLTVAYDWLLFNHYLVDRVKRGEDIFYFCFTVLEHLVADEYSITAIEQLASEQQRPASSQKVYIKREPDELATSCSFGSCGSSWEMMSGAYLRGKNLSFVGESSIPNLSPSSSPSSSMPIPVPQSAKKGSPRSSHSSFSPSCIDDLFPFDDEDEHAADADDPAYSDSESFVSIHDEPAPPASVSMRAKRLIEVKNMVGQLYRNSVPSSLSKSSGSWNWLGGSGVSSQ